MNPQKEEKHMQTLNAIQKDATLIIINNLRFERRARVILVRKRL